MIRKVVNQDWKRDIAVDRPLGCRWMVPSIRHGHHSRKEHWNAKGFSSSKAKSFLQGMQNKVSWGYFRKGKQCVIEFDNSDAEDNTGKHVSFEGGHATFRKVNRNSNQGFKSGSFEDIADYHAIRSPESTKAHQVSAARRAKRQHQDAWYFEARKVEEWAGPSSEATDGLMVDDGTGAQQAVTWEFVKNNGPFWFDVEYDLTDVKRQAMLCRHHEPGAHCKAPVGPRIMDTGATDHKVRRGEVMDVPGVRLQKREVPMKYEAAGGAVLSWFSALVPVPSLEMEITAAVLDNSPNVLSIGRLVMYEGFTFVWPRWKKPYLTSPNGRRIGCRVENLVPFIDRLGEIADEFFAEDTEERLRAMGEVQFCAKQGTSPFFPTKSCMVPQYRSRYGAAHSADDAPQCADDQLEAAESRVLPISGMDQACQTDSRCWDTAELAVQTLGEDQALELSVTDGSVRRETALVQKAEAFHRLFSGTSFTVSDACSLIQSVLAEVADVENKHHGSASSCMASLTAWLANRGETPTLQDTECESVTASPTSHGALEQIPPLAAPAVKRRPSSLGGGSLATTTWFAS